ncbi:unnamed protein product [Soboliphyme baturini]|uniref:Spb1_C domain-containing protein n=1 Tax=Soboliphyme baturini TaxID=241478 RepID=A0A183IYF6_9BILA|nr:unnamed protein product [Soboliphyme baturini]
MLNWRRDIRNILFAAKAKQAREEAHDDEVKSEEEEDAALDAEVQNALIEQKSTTKRKRKTLAKQRREYQKKVDRKMIIPGDKFDTNSAGELFSLETLEKTAGKNTADIGEALNDWKAADYFEANENDQFAENDFHISEEDTKLLPIAHSWFEKDAFNELENDEDEDLEVEVGAKRMKLEVNRTENDTENKPDVVAAPTDSDTSDDDQELTVDDNRGSSEALRQVTEKLTPEELALGELYIHSSKSRRDLIEFGFNRYANNDEGVPDWFAEEEKQYCRPNLPISREMVEKYRLRLREINARPIKKVAEAKARKKKRALRQLEKAKKKAEGILESEGITEAEKAKELRK